MTSGLVTLAAIVGPMDSGSGSFQGPSINEFYPEAFLFVGTPFEINRIMMIRIIATVALLLVFWLGTRRFSLIPGRAQGVMEWMLDFVRINIAEETLGKEQAKRFLPLLTSIFFAILAFNITGIIPGLNVASTALIGLPLLLGLLSWATFIYVGVKKFGPKYFAHALFPAGVPKPLYILITPIELLSTFVFRPLTLALRLTMNMFVGHILLVLCFTATSFFLFNVGGLWSLLGAGTFLFGFIFTLFELLVIGLQTYIFTLLTANYIQLALAEEH